MADALLIHDLVAECRVGISDEEQEHPQQIWIDLEMEIDAAKAAIRDEVDRTIDYGAMVVAVQGFLKDKTYRLIETIAEELASLVLTEFDTPQVLVRVKKRALPGIESAVVEVFRQK